MVGVFTHDPPYTAHYFPTQFTMQLSKLLTMATHGASRNSTLFD